MKNLKNNINYIYNTLEKDKQNVCKKFNIYNVRDMFNIDEKIGQSYFNLLNKYNKKNSGIVYTPKDMALYIIKQSIKEEVIIKNPYIKICDPSCGTGNILIVLFSYLKEIYNNNIEKINKIHNLNLKKEDIEKHIIKNNIFGYDIDDIAIKILKINLYYISGILSDNIIYKDFLKDNIEYMDYFIGNPPYIGHKEVDKKYIKDIREKYCEVYKDKGDIHFCFFYRAIKHLNKNGEIAFITSRYFLESRSGAILRKYIKNNINIKEIVDFYGLRPFKNVGIDPCIIFLKSCKLKNKVKVVRPYKEFSYKNFLNYFENEEDADIFYINIEENLDRWYLIKEKEHKIINKIKLKCNHKLYEICSSYQGIITGCDKAFILSLKDIEKNNIEKHIIRKWIKNKNIQKNKVIEEDRYIIYTNFIKDEREYTNAIKYVGRYKEKLKRRREVERGYRKWYELQWGRQYDLFERKKIIFPYKSKNNRFSLDYDNYFSADIYGIIIKDECKYSYDFLLKILNSPIYEFYFKTFAKKLGGELYEYYPNTLMELYIPEENDNIKNNEDLIKFFNLDNDEMEIIYSWM